MKKGMDLRSHKTTWLMFECSNGSRWTETDYSTQTKSGDRCNFSGCSTYAHKVRLVSKTQDGEIAHNWFRRSTKKLKRITDPKSHSGRILLFEGAGWDTAESNGVGNCRIRTRIKNNKGRVIYLELSGRKIGIKEKHIKGTRLEGRLFPAHVWHCFYFDIAEDKKKNYSKRLAHLQNDIFEYTKDDILQWVNKNLKCSFIDVKVDNSGDIRVHDTEKELC